MIKDIIVNLEHQVARDPARDFAISIAEVCDTISRELLSHTLRSFRAMWRWICRLTSWPR